MKRQYLLGIVLFLSILLVTVACQRGEERSVKEKKLIVITTLFPLFDFTRNITGNSATVSLLLPPGVEAHSFEPKAGDMVKINGADIIFYTGKYMEPWVEDILRGVDNKDLLVVDTSKGVTLAEGSDDHHHDRNPAKTAKHKEMDSHDHGRIDPHIWLDFDNARKMVDNIVSALITKDPANKGLYIRNAEAYKSKLDDLDRRFREGLSTCKKHTFVHGGHSAFNYLAKRYNLQYVSAYHGSPDSEPTPKQLIALKKTLKEHGVKFIYYEELITPRVSEVLARETGAKLLKLHGAHNVTREEFAKGISFLSIMEENLANLKVGLECQ
ncbi:MAG: High-affinity zinc uptake system binding-protein ZnuA precursor [Syntrophorhabdus sp. PtaU1.Bin002]|nr:MAG: High-affinity zinc uptake system binding-protein ZnuA precursor [Syntrophorhabdus sp. PtaB.Bin006]OPY72891.1 MAG: High-affinity zinc uptake system binding-protein ZnuA precursor [Syntrophorhabdus sp. PtaU1.Bin002]